MTHTRNNLNISLRCCLAARCTDLTPAAFIGSGVFLWTHCNGGKFVRSLDAYETASAGLARYGDEKDKRKPRGTVNGTGRMNEPFHWIRSHCSGPLEFWPESTRVASRAKGTMCDGLTVRARRARLRAAAMLSDAGWAFCRFWR